MSLIANLLFTLAWTAVMAGWCALTIRRIRIDRGRDEFRWVGFDMSKANHPGPHRIMLVWRWIGAVLTGAFSVIGLVFIADAIQRF